MNNSKLTPKAVIFDLGSTLIEYEATPWDKLNLLGAESAHLFLTQNGHSVPEKTLFCEAYEKSKETFRKVSAETHTEWTIVQAAEHLFNELKLSYDKKLLDSFFDAFYAPVEDLLYVYDDTLSTLEILKTHSMPIGLISNTIFPERAHRHELKRFGIAPYLSFEVFSSTFGKKKPHPDIFHYAASLAGARPENCVYVGDRYLEDIVGPNQIGMPAILKLTDNRDYPADKLPLTRQVKKLSEIFDHISI
ncbi:MAG: HAD family hydrolase [candidate division Zixibacteria bacterium]|nr:HAD family hydrolase [candidate division Zixibacteria bacterium]